MDKFLRKAIEVKFGKAIQFQKDILDLKDDVYYITSSSLGFNTLRRCFGFLPSVNTSRKSLNILSNYVGYKSYSHFLNRDIENKLWDDWLVVNVWLSKKSLNQFDFEVLSSFRNREYYYLILSRIISHFFATNNMKLLVLLFKDQSLFINNHRTIMARIATSLHYDIVHMSDQDLLNIKPLLELKSFRDHAIYGWVDYDHVHGYFGTLFDFSLEYIENSDEQLFSNLFGLLLDFLNQRPPHCSYESLKLPEPCHQILLGRYLSIQLIYSPSNKKEMVLNRIMNLSQSQKSRNEFFQEIIPVLILKREFSFLEQVMDIYYNDLIGYLHWDHVSIERYNLMALSIVYLKNEELDNIPLILKFFNFKKDFHVNDNYHKIFYSIVLYHYYLKINESEDKIKEAENLYSDLSSKLKFEIFNLGYLHSYFDK
jgi:hypothetical protein